MRGDEKRRIIHWKKKKNREEGGKEGRILVSLLWHKRLAANLSVVLSLLNI